MSTLVVDGANVVGSRPDGWWKDRAGAARRLHDQLLQADLDHDQVVLVLEGGAKAGVRAGRDLHVRTVHASRDGDSAIVALVTELAGQGERCTVVTADRVLGGLVSARGAVVSSPSYLLERLS